MTGSLRQVMFEATRDPNPPSWQVAFPWRWAIFAPRGVLLADGEGCQSAGDAIKVARIVAWQEGWRESLV